MDDLLVFSHKRKIRCCAFLNKDIIILVDDGCLCLFDIGKAKIVAEEMLNECLHGICVWVRENKEITIQGKMGFNYLYTYAGQQIKLKHKYQTWVHGFCRMTLWGDKTLVGVS